MKTLKIKKIFALIYIVVIFLAGCSSIGPRSVPRDRFDYNTAIADSWKEQTLLNIVRLRYADMPLFVEVASVVGGYTLESSVNLGGTLSSENAVQGDFLSLGGAGKYTDRPTITYAPITGDKFNKSFMTPIPPRIILFLIESGWPPELIFPITLDSINGLQSHRASGYYKRKGDPNFYRAVSLFQKIQSSGYTSMRVIKNMKGKEDTLIVIRRDSIPTEINASIEELEKLLGVRPGSNKLKVTYGDIPETDQELALQSMSLMRIMIAMSQLIDVPSEHIAGGVTFPSIPPSNSEDTKMGQIINIHHASNKPEGDFVSVRYKDYWFYIEDSDFASKRTFSFLMVLFSITETGGNQGLPLVTIPSG